MRIHTSLLAAGALALASCAGGGDETGELAVEITDAFLPHSQVVEALVAVTEVRVHRDANDDGSGWLDVYSGPARWIDLASLRNGLREVLGRADLPRGTYRQVRLVFAEGRLELVNGNVYTTDDGSLKITSQATSGLKVFVDPPVGVVAGQSRTLLLDVDLSKTFKPTPANDPLNATTYKLQPVMKATNLTSTGEIRGVVTEGDGSGAIVPSDDASVFLLPPGETDVANAITTTGTMADGRYAFLGVLPGVYDVLADDGTGTARADAQAVTVGGITVVDLELP